MTESLYLPSPNWEALISNDFPNILDVGANDGGTSQVFQTIFQHARVYAFEPDPRAISNCKLRVSTGKIDKSRFELYEGAVCDQNGTAEFFQSDGMNPDFNWYPSGYDLSGSLMKPVSERPLDIKSIYFNKSILVSTITLDEWSKDKELQQIDLLWIDVQGAEAKVILGAQNILKKVRFIYLECEETKTYENQPKLENLIEILSNFDLIQSYIDGNHLFKMNGLT